MPAVRSSGGRRRPHWSTAMMSWTLAAAATVVGVHLAVAAPAVSPVQPPLAAAANDVTTATVPQTVQDTRTADRDDDARRTRGRQRG